MQYPTVKIQSTNQDSVLSQANHFLNLGWQIDFSTTHRKWLIGKKIYTVTLSLRPSAEEVLKAELDRLLANDNFEEAAVIRDRIANLKTQQGLNPNN